MPDLIPSTLLAFAAILVGFAGLVWSADRFVAGAAAIAKSFGVTPLVIGLTIVSFGTSAPEVMVSVNAAIRDAGQLAVGNAIGSNIANIALVLGVTLLVSAIPLQRHLLRQELPVLLLVTAVAGAFLFDRAMARWESILFLASLVPVIFYLVKSKQAELTPGEIAEELDEVPDMPRGAALLWFVIGLVILIVSADILVWGAKTTAESFGVSQLVIGLTVIAVGTSLPELAASVMSALKGHHDIAVGNIIGSNIFNLMAVMAIPGVMRPLPLDDAVFARDYLAMLGVTLLLALAIAAKLLFTKPTAGAHLGRVMGVVLLTLYVGYMALLGLT